MGGQAGVMTHSSSSLLQAAATAVTWRTHTHAECQGDLHILINTSLGHGGARSALPLTHPHPRISHIPHVWPWERLVD